MRRWFCLLAVLGLLAAEAQAQRTFTHEDLIAMRRLGAVAPSPDGTQAVLLVRSYHYDRPGPTGDLYLLEADGSGQARQLTRTEAAEGDPAWHPDGRSLAFTAPDSAGRRQLFRLDLATGTRQQLTDLATGVRQPQFSPDGRTLTFLSDVFPDAADPAENRARLEAEAAKQTSGRIYTGFPYRTYGNEWFDGRVPHLFAVPADSGTVRDLLAATGVTRERGWSGVMEYDWHPDGTQLVFSASLDFDRQADRFDTKDLFLVPVRRTEGGGVRRAAEPTLLVDRYTNDRFPQFSPDGRYLAWLARWCCWGSLPAEDRVDGGLLAAPPPLRTDSLPSYQDNRILVRDQETGQVTVLMDAWDRPPNAPAWSPDGEELIFSAPDAGHNRLFRITLADAFAGQPPTVLATQPGSWGQPRVGGSRVFATRESTTAPPELFALDLRRADRRPAPRLLTAINTKHLEDIPMRPAQEVFWTYASRRLQGWLVKPPDFDENKVYPLLLFPHGGPFGMHADRFHYRWNAQLFAAHGFVVFMPNPTGSTGFGEEFAADVQGEWGGRVFHEVMAGVDHLLATQPYLREDQLVAASASYGGYFMNWLITQTDRFQAVFTHASIWNFVSMTGTSIIAHYMLMDASGQPPWEDFDAFNRYSPHYHAANITTPTYVSHGGMDAGVPQGQGLELYWTLQYLGVESKLLYFPDEGHWILQPANSRLWYNELLTWLQQHLPPG